MDDDWPSSAKSLTRHALPGLDGAGPAQSQGLDPWTLVGATGCGVPTMKSGSAGERGEGYQRNGDEGQVHRCEEQRAGCIEVCRDGHERDGD